MKSLLRALWLLLSCVFHFTSRFSSSVWEMLFDSFVPNIPCVFSPLHFCLCYFLYLFGLLIFQGPISVPPLQWSFSWIVHSSLTPRILDICFSPLGRWLLPGTSPLQRGNAGALPIHRALIRFAHLCEFAHVCVYMCAYLIECDPLIPLLDTLIAAGPKWGDGWFCSSVSLNRIETYTEFARSNLPFLLVFHLFG